MSGKWHKRRCIRDPIIEQYEEVMFASFLRGLSSVLFRANVYIFSLIQLTNGMNIPLVNINYIAQSAHRNSGNL